LKILEKVAISAALPLEAARSAVSYCTNVSNFNRVGQCAVELVMI